MGGVEWDALDMVAEMLGVRDVESWISDLATLRDWHRKRAG